jgi:hypothetical protein
VLELPADKRAELARRPLISLEHPDFDADVEEAWAAEVEARLAAADRDEPSLVDWRPAVDRMPWSLDRDATR